jgi:hypothetical protein
MAAFADGWGVSKASSAHNGDTLFKPPPPPPFAHRHHHQHIFGSIIWSKGEGTCDSDSARLLRRRSSTARRMMMDSLCCTWQASMRTNVLRLKFSAVLELDPTRPSVRPSVCLSVHRHSLTQPVHILVLLPELSLLLRSLLPHTSLTTLAKSTDRN